MIELLASLAITAMIASFAIGGIEFSNRAWTMSRNADEESQVDAGTMRLTDILSKAESASALDQSRGIASLLFQGRPDSLTFVTLSEGYALHGGLAKAQIAWDKSASSSGVTSHDNSGITIRTEVFRPSGNGDALSQPAVLLHGVSSFGMRYFGSIELNQAPQWSAQWLGRDRLPMLIAVDLDVEVHDKPRHLSLMIPLRHNLP